MNTHTWTCAFCGKAETGINGPVEPASASVTDDPPCTGWHRYEGPSYGMGFPVKAQMYCSVACLTSKLQGETPTIEGTIEVIKGWKAIKTQRPPRPTPRSSMPQELKQPHELEENRMETQEDEEPPKPEYPDTSYLNEAQHEPPEEAPYEPSE